MATRTFKQFGLGFAANPISVTVKLGGTTIFAGTVPLINRPVIALPAPQDELDSVGEIWSWTRDTTFAAAENYEIIVNGGPGHLLLAQTLANYGQRPYVRNLGEPGPGDENDWSSPRRYFAVGSSGFVYNNDPISDVAFDGEPVIFAETEMHGQRFWVIPTGTVMTATLTTNLPHTAED